MVPVTLNPVLAPLDRSLVGGAAPRAMPTCTGFSVDEICPSAAKGTSAIAARATAKRERFKTTPLLMEASAPGRSAAVKTLNPVYPLMSRIIRRLLFNASLRRTGVLRSNGLVCLCCFSSYPYQSRRCHGFVLDDVTRIDSLQTPIACIGECCATRVTCRPQGRRVDALQRCVG